MNCITVDARGPFSNPRLYALLSTYAQPNVDMAEPLPGFARGIVHKITESLLVTSVLLLYRVYI